MEKEYLELEYKDLGIQRVNISVKFIRTILTTRDLFGTFGLFQFYFVWNFLIGSLESDYAAP